MTLPVLSGKNSTEAQVSNFKLKSIFIHAGHINYRCYQTIYTIVVLENYLYMMLSEGKMTSYLQLALIRSD